MTPLQVIQLIVALAGATQDVLGVIAEMQKLGLPGATDAHLATINAAMGQIQAACPAPWKPAA